MYKIEAVILKQGCMPVKWVRYVGSPMTIRQCKALITPSPKTATFKTATFKANLFNIEITDFSCVKCSKK